MNHLNPAGPAAVIQRGGGRAANRAAMEAAAMTAFMALMVLILCCDGAAMLQLCALPANQTLGEPQPVFKRLELLETLPS